MRRRERIEGRPPPGGSMFGPFALKGRPEASSEHTRTKNTLKNTKSCRKGCRPGAERPPKWYPGTPQKASKFHFGALGCQEGAPRGFRGTPRVTKTPKSHPGTSKTHPSQRRLCKKNAGILSCLEGQVRRRICRQSRKKRIRLDKDSAKKRDYSVMFRGAFSKWNDRH